MVLIHPNNSLFSVMIQLQDEHICASYADISLYHISYIPNMIYILSGSVLDRLYMDIVIYHSYPTAMIYIPSGSVLDRLYMYIMIYHTYPKPMRSILSGSVLDRPCMYIVIYHTYPKSMRSILSGSVLDRLYTDISCNIIHTQRQ